MELRHLRYFTAIAQAGSVSGAAQRLHVSQSAISEQILDLENEIGGKLLDRSGRKVSLTPEGSVFLQEAQKTLAAADRAVELTRSSLRGDSGTLAIGFFLWGAGGFFPRIIREFRRRRPGIRLSLVEMHASQQLPAIEEGRLDVGLTRPLTPPHDKRLRSEELYRDPVVVAVRPDHPFAGREIAVRSLAGEPLVLCERVANPVLFDGILSLCSTHGFSPRIVNTSSTWSGVLTLVEAGEGVALVPAGVRHLRTKGLSFCSLAPGTLSLGLSVVWNPQNEGVALQDFLALLRENRSRIEKHGGG